jgi:hypothetical protein
LVRDLISNHTSAVCGACGATRHHRVRKWGTEGIDFQSVGLTCGRPRNEKGGELSVFSDGASYDVLGAIFHRGGAEGPETVEQGVEIETVVFLEVQGAGEAKLAGFFPRKTRVFVSVVRRATR